ncbi:hypothetical protein BDA99DRAFT_535923 [Phascolomyces articulosus]|uniref:Uncharacterized protein n=1 Tax=Phascolomyces articulosus TaxID=60185 RepID=A0AAD5PF54_9FUNG|nr:hypothetical protein BDA99DRAFT_535923 [Phascolomyces articulosus]
MREHLSTILFLTILENKLVSRTTLATFCSGNVALAPSFVGISSFPCTLPFRGKALDPIQYLFERSNSYFKSFYFTCAPSSAFGIAGTFHTQRRDAIKSKIGDLGG